MINSLYPVQSRPTVDFIEALAAASGALQPPYIGSAVYPLYGLPPWGSRRYLIRAIEFVAVESIGLEFNFFSAATSGMGAVATANFVSSFALLKANGAQYNSAGTFKYYTDGLAIPYYNLTDANANLAAPAMYVGVQNCDTTAKSAGAAGAIAVTIWCEPRDGA